MVAIIARCWQVLPNPLNPLCYIILNGAGGLQIQISALAEAAATTRAIIADDTWSSLQVCIYVLAIVLSFVLGAAWTLWKVTHAHNRHPDVEGSTKPSFWDSGAAGLAQGSFIALITYGGAVFLARWNVYAPGPVIGICWTLGFVLGVLLSYGHIVNQHARAASDLDVNARIRIRGLIWRKLLTKGTDQVERLVADEVSATRLRESDDGLVLNCIEHLHLLIHSARDNVVPYVEQYGQVLGPAVEQSLSTGAPIDDERLRKDLEALKERHLRPILMHLLSVFQPLVGEGVPLWIAIREASIRKRDSKMVLRTLIRVPENFNGRQNASEPVPIDEGLPAYLMAQYTAGNPIVILTSKEKRDPRKWRKGTCDKRKEDQTVMAAPIFLQKPMADRELAMILYFNSAKDGVFSEKLFPYVKCCTDLLSMFFSAASKGAHVLSVERTMDGQH